MYVHHVLAVPSGPDKGTGVTGSGVTDGYESPHGFWLLSTEPSLHPMSKQMTIEKLFRVLMESPECLLLEVY